ncbi:MAG TPA: DUF499 domain-containing protein [Candidatus Hydrogenedentes bacterium]|nr:DUF499 domain-containing protein [Candidatus Hydrogenedentota bacterium]
MPKQPWTPWHEVVALRDDVKTGELSLNLFAADLYDVKVGKAPKVYQAPEEFFALTYPTHNLRMLAKEVILRLAAKNDKAIRQLELTYGGGKTHTLITLLHLVQDPDSLPDLPAVDQFLAELDGLKPPKSRVVVLPFDKLDVEKGMEIGDPDGNMRWLKQPWSVLAWQLMGTAGIKLLHPDDKDEERDSAPAEPLVQQLLEAPQKDGLATLVLLDEVLMYARDKIARNKSFEGYLQSFFQALTQAATKVKKCAVVASLLASDPKKWDTSGKRIEAEFRNIFRRGQEEGVQPVVKEDVAEVLRRRFFTPESIRDREKFKPHVTAALKGVTDLDEQTRKEASNAEERFLNSYPFHPDLTEVFYSKWTQMERFQRTRGVLRTFALALRDAVKWDNSPLVGTNVFLTAPGGKDISEGLRELTSVAGTEEYEGKRQEWDKIVQGELEKAGDVQDESTALKNREIEQAVVATFLHSQPVGGHKALTRELTVLVAPTRPDKIEFEKGLRRWSDISWFLDEACLEDAATGPNGEKLLPKSWRLGAKPNLRQMHSDAVQNRIATDLVEQQLVQFIQKTSSLTSGASPMGARVHNLPNSPADIKDDGEFHYAILGPSAASMSGSPSAEAKRFINETTAPDRPRVNRNAIVLAVPSRDGLDAARNQIRDYLGWVEVQSQLKEQEIDPIRTARLQGHLDDSKNKIPDAIRQAYSIVVTVNEKDEIHAFKVTVESDPLFTTIKNDRRSRIEDTAINAEALLPDGPYALWKGGETERRVKDLAGAFAQFPHLPKMLRHQEILNTLALGAAQGNFVLRLRRPDGSFRTFWMQQPSEADMKDPGLELVLPEAAELAELPAELLRSNVLPGLWKPGQTLAFKSLCEYFDGSTVIRVDKGGYDEPQPIPKAEASLLETAANQAVESGMVWLVAGQASIWKEPVPTGLISGGALLLPPPAAVPVVDVLRDNLPDAWKGDETTAIAITTALSQKSGQNMPWPVVKDAIDGALRSHFLERTVDSGPWPCDLAGASVVKLKVPSGVPPTPPAPPLRPGVVSAKAELKASAIQDLADVVSDIVKAAAGCDIKFTVNVELGGEEPASAETIAQINEILKGVAEGMELK